MLIACAGPAVVGRPRPARPPAGAVSESTERRAGRGGAALSVVAVVVGIVVAGVASATRSTGRRPLAGLQGRLRPGGLSVSRFSGDLGSGRYDFWRVGLNDEFAAAPVLGEGADNFAVGYLEHRDTSEEPLYPHSLPIRLLAGTGIVGTAPLPGFLVAAVAAFRCRARAPDPLARGVAAVALATAAYFFLHSSGDWLWTFAAITMPVIAWLGIAGGGLRLREPPVAPVPSVPASRAGSGWPPPVAWCGGGVASLALPWISARLTDSAASGWPADPEEALARLDTARELNPLSARPDLVAGTIAIRNGDAEGGAGGIRAGCRARADELVRAARARHPRHRRRGSEPQGIVQLREGREAEPDEPLIATALRRARSVNPLTPQQIDRVLIDRVCTIGWDRPTEPAIAKTRQNFPHTLSSAPNYAMMRTVTPGRRHRSSVCRSATSSHHSTRGFEWPVAGSHRGSTS